MTHHLTTTTKHHLRASWIATVLNLDWPSKQSLAISNEAERVALQQRELTAMLDEAVSLRMNAVFFQVRPCADAFYRSTLVPWSRYLTGTLGQDPGFDPLAFVIEQAHRRNLELHAWFNPYRVSMDRSPATVEQLNRVAPGRPASVYQAQPQWIASASDRFVIDPGIPQARSAIVEAVMEVARNYDIDGVHFDDYFYYESAASPLDDSATFARYGQDFTDKGDWRRDNTYQLIRELSAALREFDPGIKFGVSPAGVWRNQSVDPLGSATRHGAPNYDVGFADTRRWVHEELLDYILPQVYWTFDLEVAPFEVVAKWWADTVHGRNVHLFIGEALYKVGGRQCPGTGLGRGRGHHANQSAIELEHRQPAGKRQRAVSPPVATCTPGCTGRRGDPRASVATPGIDPGHGLEDRSRTSTPGGRAARGDGGGHSIAVAGPPGQHARPDPLLRRVPQCAGQSAGHHARRLPGGDGAL